MLNLFKRSLPIMVLCALCLSFMVGCGNTDKDSSSVDISSDGSNSSEEALASSNLSAEASEPEAEKPAGPHDPITPLPEDGDIKANDIDAFFDNSVFIGYSIMMHFGRYVNEWRSEVAPSFLGDALFCAGVSMSFTTDRIQSPDMPDISLPLYQGQAYNFADLPIATGCDTLYIGLPGYSDLKRAPNPNICVMYAYGEFVQGIQRIKAKNPELNIVILSCTYNTAIYEGLTRFNCSNDKVMEYNNMVLDYCNTEGIDFIDVSTALTDRSGLLVADYTTDGEYHIIKNAYYIWVEALRDYAAKKQEGTWENIKIMPVLPAI